MKYTSLLKRFLIVALVLMGNNIFSQNINIPTLPAGDSIVIISSVTINTPFTNNPSQVSKQHTISGANFSNVLSNDPKTAGANDPTITPVTAVTGSDLSITKTDSPDPVIAGNNITYTITLSNLDVTTPAATVAVTDVLPTGTTFVSLSAPAGWSTTTPAVGTNGTVTITKASLANADGLQTFTLVVKVDAGVANATVISNTASVTTTTTESNSANNTSTATTTVTAPTSDLSISKTDSPDPVVAGNNITYTITLSNLDVTTAAQTVSVSDVLPTGTTFVSLSAPAGWSTTTPAVGTNGTVTITKASVANADGLQTFTLVVKVDAGVANATVISNTASVSTTTTESNSANNTSTATTTVTAPTSDLSISKTDSPDPVVAGNNLTYTITLSNLDVTTAAQTVSVSDVLPTGTTFVSLSAPAGWSTTTPAVGTNGTVTITKASVANADGLQTFTLVVNVNSGVAGGTVISNTASVTTTTGESNSANNTSTATTTVNAPAGSLITDHYRTKQSGNWNAVATWESSPDNTSWINATLTPNFNSNTITIRNAHTVTVTASVTTDQTVVNGGGILAVATGATLTVNGNGLTIQSTATATGMIGNSAGTISGNVTVERFISAASSRSAWRLLTAPLTGSSNNSVFATWQNGGVNTSGRGTAVTGPTYVGATGGVPGTPVSDANGLDYSTLGNSLKSFDGVNLQNVANTKTTLLFSPTTNNSYFIFINGDRSAFSGSANQTTLSATGSVRMGNVTFTNPTGTTFGLIGNPYASPVDLNQFRLGNTGSAINSTYWYWDPYLSGSFGVGGYVTVSYDGGGNETITPAGAAHTRFLQSGQAMFIQGSGAGPTTPVTFTESQKGTTNVNNIFRTTSGNIEKLGINLNIAANGTSTLTDGIVASFDDSYNAALDNYDAVKFYNVGESIALMRDNKSFSIERRPMPKVDDVLFLNLSNLKVDRSYQFEFTPDFNAPAFSAYLKDNYLKTATPIDVHANSKVDFTITSDAASTGAGRFSIVFAKPSPVISGSSSIRVYPNPVTGGLVTLQFSNMPEGSYTVRVLNNLGQAIITKQISHSAGSNLETIQLGKGVKGVYQVEVIKPDASKFSTKIIAY